MNQEKRWCQRREVKLHANIYNWKGNSLELLRCTISNMSLGGLFFTTEDMDFPLYKEIKLVISPHEGLIDEGHNITARIMQKTNSGFGLQFTKVKIDTVNAIRAICNSNSNGTPQPETILA